MVKVSKGESLDRYYLFKFLGFGLFLHKIHGSDPFGIWHNHPWSGISFIFGKYGEEMADVEITPFDQHPHKVHTRFKVRWFVNFIRAKQYHRVLVTHPTWTLFFHFRKSNKWSAIDRHGNVADEPWKGVGVGRSYSGALQGDKLIVKSDEVLSVKPSITIDAAGNITDMTVKTEVLTGYKAWTTLRLLHYYFHQPNYEDRDGIEAELRSRDYAGWRHSGPDRLDGQPHSGT